MILNCSHADFGHLHGWDKCTDLQNYSYLQIIEKTGVSMNLNKSKILSPYEVQIHVGDNVVEKVEQDVYLGHQN